MRKTIVALTVLSLAGALSCGATALAAAPNTAHAGITGATIKRPAVQNPDTVDFGGDVQSVQSYDLDGSAAGVNQVVGNADTARDQEIDSIVNQISNEPKAMPASVKPPALRPQAVPGAAPRVRRPAVPPKAGASAAFGVTASINRPRNDERAPSLPPLPQPMHVASAQQEDNAQKHDQLIEKPLWRRQLAQKQAGAPVTAPSGN